MDTKCKTPGRLAPGVILKILHREASGLADRFNNRYLRCPGEPSVANRPLVLFAANRTFGADKLSTDPQQSANFRRDPTIYLLFGLWAGEDQTFHFYSLPADFPYVNQTRLAEKSSIRGG